MARFTYKELCSMLNVTDKDIKNMLDSNIKKNDTDINGYGFTWMHEKVLPGVKLNAEELGNLCQYFMNFGNLNDYPKYEKLYTVTAMLFTYKIKVFGESF